MRRGVRKGAHLGISPPLMVREEEAAAEEGAEGICGHGFGSRLPLESGFYPRRIHPSSLLLVLNAYCNCRINENRDSV
jgi:hypothetical protein